MSVLTGVICLAESAKEASRRRGIDNSSKLLFSEIWPCRSRTLVRTFNVDIHYKVPVLVLHVPEADISQDTSIIDEDVDAAEVLNGGLNDLVAFDHAVVVGHGLATRSFDFIDHNIVVL